MSKTLFLSIINSPILTADRAHQRLVARVKPRAKVLVFARRVIQFPHMPERLGTKKRSTPP